MTVRQQRKYISALNKNPQYAKYKSFHWADYIELLCLASLDGELSEDDLMDRLSERRDLEEGDLNDVKKIQVLEEGNGVISERSKISDTIRTEVSDWFQLLEIRSAMYGNTYPFIITEKEIKRKKGKFSSDQKLYVYLLLSSNLYLFDEKVIGSLSNSFELLSHEVLKNILPKNGISHLFGSNPLNRTGRYGTRFSFWEKINRLADDLHVKLNPEIEERHYPKRHRGDDGLDIVAWIPTGDSVSSSLVFLGQCACSSKEWKRKQSDSSYSAWANKIRFTTYTNNIIFIPFCFRHTDGNWFNIGDIQNSFLIDRKRIIHYLSKNYSKFNTLPVASIVDDIINVRDGVV